MQACTRSAMTAVRRAYGPGQADAAAAARPKGPAAAAQAAASAGKSFAAAGGPQGVPGTMHAASRGASQVRYRIQHLRQRPACGGNCGRLIVVKFVRRLGLGPAVALHISCNPFAAPGTTPQSQLQRTALLGVVTGCGKRLAAGWLRPLHLAPSGRIWSGLPPASSTYRHELSCRGTTLHFTLLTNGTDVLYALLNLRTL